MSNHFLKEIRPDYVKLSVQLAHGFQNKTIVCNYASDVVQSTEI